MANCTFYLTQNDDSESTRAESSQSFTVTYPTPVVTEFPKGGRVGNNVEILGTDLDIISKVYMGDEEGEIVYQSEEEIAVKVPFIIDDNTTVSLKYTNQTGGESEIKGESDDFLVEKDQPEIEKIDQESLMERSLLTLSGTHLNLIEYIYLEKRNALQSVRKKISLYLEYRLWMKQVQCK